MMNGISYLKEKTQSFNRVIFEGLMYWSIIMWEDFTSILRKLLNDSYIIIEYTGLHYEIIQMFQLHLSQSIFVTIPFWYK